MAILSSCGFFYLTVTSASLLHFFLRGEDLFKLSLILLIIIFTCWWRDVIREGTFTRHHTVEVQKSLRLGMLLFIVSEVLFFFAFFWAFFHSSLAPTHALGCVWPPAAIDVFSPFEIPLLNTCILLTSGATITLAHYTLLQGNRIVTEQALLATIVLAIIFTSLQGFEYFAAPFSIADGVYASTFYLATGFHGLHVIIGTLFIMVSFARYHAYHFTFSNHFGFEASAWYWHFVDVVWLILYISIYYWGNLY
jgi:cytochrome c oxidase subunit 3